MSSVVAVIVTHKRPAELRRLLDGLAASEMGLTGCVISDHAPDGTTRELADQAALETLVLEDASNPGPGAGWANAVRKALGRFPDLEAIWYLDDDVVIAPTTLGTLWREMTRVHATAIAPLLEDSAGQLWAFPEPVDRAARRRIREADTPKEARQLLGAEPLPFCWCTGACFLVGRAALDSTPLHRTDFWMLGEDLEYSMRIAAGNHAVFTCQVSVPHLPPEKKNCLTQRPQRTQRQGNQVGAEEKTDVTPKAHGESCHTESHGGITRENLPPPQSNFPLRKCLTQRPQRTQRGNHVGAEEEEFNPPTSDNPSKIENRKSKIHQGGYLKFCSLLQNLCYLAFHARESRHMKWYLPGNFRRFFRTYGFGWSTFREAVHCLWFGAVRGQPAGTKSGQRLRQRVSGPLCHS